MRRADGPALPDGFLEVAARVYAADQDWIPEEPHLVAAAFDAANPWFLGGRAVALCAPGRARLAAFFEPDRRVDGRPAAFFGYWETTGEAGVDAALFAEAEEWARAAGAVDLYGPINFTTYGAYRLRLGAEPGGLPFPGEPYNPPYAPRVLAELGFAAHQTYLTQVSDMANARRLREAKRPVLDAVRARGYRVESRGHETWLEHLEHFHGLADAIFGDGFGYRPLPFSAFARACGEAFIARACPHTSVIAYAPDGAVAGVFLVSPHYGPLTVQGAPKRVAASALRFDAHHAGLRAAVARTVGVAPGQRRRGVMDALTVAMLDRGEGRYDQWLGAMIRSDNPSARFAAGKVPHQRAYALYRKALA